MALDTQYTTFVDLYNGLLRAIRESTSVAATVDEAQRHINTALHDIHLGEDRGSFWWAERRARLVTAPPYSTGTIAITAAARTTVTGTDTLWNTAVTGFGVNNVRAGYKLLAGGQQEIYTIDSVASDTSLTLLDTYTGDALTASDYTIFADEYTLVSDFGVPADARNFSDEAEISFIGSRDFYRRFPRNNTTGRPRVATIITSAVTSSGPERRVVFHPAPNDQYSIPYRYMTTNLALSSAGVAQAQLTVDTDIPIIPLRYRHVIVLHALFNWYRDRKDDQRSQEVRNEYVDLLRRIRAETSPTQDHPRIKIQRPPTPSFSRSGRRPRYDTPSEWFETFRDKGRW